MGVLDRPQASRQRDEDLPTRTSEAQRATEVDVGLSFEPYRRSRPSPLPRNRIALERNLHARYLRNALRTLGPKMVSLDASRPWLAYWILHGLYLLDEPLDEITVQNAIETIRSFQHPEGGFGGGCGQVAHLATTYAAVNSLVILGTREAYDVIDRDRLYLWLLRLKQPDGSFIMHHAGERDVRGSYCAFSVAALLNLLTPELTAGAAEFIARCQTYEGGLGAVPGVEAHGGYTYCAVAAMEILGCMSMLNLHKLLKWAVQQQMNFEGGFRGRTNKLVDGCYSFWVGGLFPLLSSELNERTQERPSPGPIDMYDREALQEYLLVACQVGPRRGGMRDKPGKAPDYYHTCYCLSGLSTAQHRVTADAARFQQRGGLSSLFWLPNADDELVVGLSANALRPTHPVHNVGIEFVQRIMSYTYGAEAVASVLRMVNGGPANISEPGWGS